MVFISVSLIFVISWYSNILGLFSCYIKYQSFQHYNVLLLVVSYIIKHLQCQVCIQLYPGCNVVSYMYVLNNHYLCYIFQQLNCCCSFFKFYSTYDENALNFIKVLLLTV